MTEWLTAVGIILTPIVVATLGIWFNRQQQASERRAALDRQMQEDRVQVYRDILEPFSVMFTSDVAWANEQRKDKALRNKSKDEVAQELMLSKNWVAQSMFMSLVASDEVLNSYNALLMFARQSTPDEQSGSTSDKSTQMLENLATFLLAIRKNAGNEGTAISKWDMLRWLITDLDSAVATDER